MRLRAAVLLALVALGVAWLWASGGFGSFAWWVQGQQRAMQSALAAEASALRSGEAGPLWSLIVVCGAYGFLHALGPGHGKALIASAAVASRATARRMASVALAGSLAQALVAVTLVYGGFALVGATARGMTDGADRWLTPLADTVVILIGVVLLARGLNAFLRRSTAAHRCRAHHAGCGHDHGPTAEQTTRARTTWATLGLIGGMAARPCTGAVFVLVIAWRMDMPAAGVAAVAAMGVGAAGFTALVAWLAVASRDAAFLTAGTGVFGTRLVPALQVLAGGLLVLTSGASLWVGAPA